MYQEAIEQAGREINIFEIAKMSLTCPRTEFGILQPNPECERLDAALAAMCQPEDDFPVLPRPERIDDMNAVTFIEEELLEKVFEFYCRDSRHFDSDIYQVDSQCGPSRCYHAGRIYGSGQYGNAEEEARYQAFIRDPDMVFEVLDEYNNRQMEEYSFDDLQDEPIITMTIPNRPTEIEEGEIIDVYPHDLLDPEPFIRAPVISYEAAQIMADEFAENYLDSYDEEDPYDAILERLQDPHEALREWEESDWVRDHPDPMISRIYVQATDRRY